MGVGVGRGRHTTTTDATGAPGHASDQELRCSPNDRLPSVEHEYIAYEQRSKRPIARPNVGLDPANPLDLSPLLLGTSHVGGRSALPTVRLRGGDVSQLAASP